MADAPLATSDSSDVPDEADGCGCVRDSRLSQSRCGPCDRLVCCSAGLLFLLSLVLDRSLNRQQMDCVLNGL